MSSTITVVLSENILLGNNYNELNSCEFGKLNSPYRFKWWSNRWFSWYRVHTVTVMLVTMLYWWLNDSDSFRILVTESLYNTRDFFVMLKTFVINRWPASQICHQLLKLHQKKSPISVTNIDFTTVTYERRQFKYTNVFFLLKTFNSHEF